MNPTLEVDDMESAEISDEEIDNLTSREAGEILASEQEGFRTTFGDELRMLMRL